MTSKNPNKPLLLRHDSWEEHVRYEIMDACTDPDRLLAILDSLTEMEKLDLIPDQTADSLFEMIRSINDRISS